MKWLVFPGGKIFSSTRYFYFLQTFQKYTLGEGSSPNQHFYLFTNQVCEHNVAPRVAAKNSYSQTKAMNFLKMVLLFIDEHLSSQELQPFQTDPHTFFLPNSSCPGKFSLSAFHCIVLCPELSATSLASFCSRKPGQLLFILCFSS